MLRRLPIALGAGLLTLALVSCSQADGDAYARQACGHVQASLRLWAQAQSAPAANGAGLRARALAELRAAQPLAAQAASDASEYQALMATVSEVSLVDESRLVHALGAQCQAVRSGQASTS